MIKQLFCTQLLTYPSRQWMKLVKLIFYARCREFSIGHKQQTYKPPRMPPPPLLLILSFTWNFALLIWPNHLILLRNLCFIIWVLSKFNQFWNHLKSIPASLTLFTIYTTLLIWLLFQMLVGLSYSVTVHH